jgi:hypothetical protein
MPGTPYKKLRILKKVPRSNCRIVTMASPSRSKLTGEQSNKIKRKRKK